MAFAHYRCAAHIINLAVKAGMDYVRNEIKKHRQFVIKVKNSPLLLDKFVILKRLNFLNQF